MKKRSWVLTTVLTVALLLSPAAAVSAQPNAAAPTQCVVGIEFNDYGDGSYWYGPITGCSLEGMIRFDEKWDDNYVVGTTEHFFETFTIWPASGGEITGENEGVWNFGTFKFRANGLVTSASPEWEHLVGYKLHEMGTTSDPADGLPITAPNTAMTLHAP